MDVVHKTTVLVLLVHALSVALVQAASSFIHFRFRLEPFRGE